MFFKGNREKQFDGRARSGAALRMHTGNRQEEVRTAENTRWESIR